MQKRETWLFVFAAIGAIAALVKILEYCHITPPEWGRVVSQPFPSLGPLVWGLLLFAFSIGLSAYGIVLTKKRQAKSHTSDSDSRATLRSPEWLERLADEDERHIQATIYCPDTNFKLYDLIGPEPSIHLTIDMINASVFDLKAEQTDGRMRWNNTQFECPLEIRGFVKHADRTPLELTQPIRPSEAQKLKSLRINISFEEVDFYFSYRDRHGNQKTFKARLATPTQGFSISS